MTRADRTWWIGLSLLLVAGCATVPSDPAARAEFKANNDAFEPLNRRIFAFNLALDRIIIKPAAKGYRAALPQKVRDGLRHFLDNLDEPLVMGNCILQWRLKSAATAGGRFVVNSTAGVAGIADVATEWKLPKQVGDFGQTLWAWGIGEGPYLIVPVFGPSSPRDGIGQLVDLYLDPLLHIPAHENYPAWFKTGRVLADGIDQRARNLDALDEIQRESIDYYAAFRSYYRQNRAAKLRNGKTSTTLPAADFYDDSGK